MVSIGSEGESLKDYFERLDEHMQKAANLEQRLVQITAIAKSAENHFSRLEYARRRHARALLHKDSLAANYETQCILALMYEILDTGYIVFNLLDFDSLGLKSSADGFGLAGDQAHAVIQLLNTLDSQAARLLALEKELMLKADFTIPVDERENVTYVKRRHWQDYVSGSIEQSFFHYFSRAKETVTQHLEKKPSFWAAQDMRRYLKSKGYTALLETLTRLESARFPG